MKHDIKSGVLTFYLIILFISFPFLIFTINSCKSNAIAAPPDVGVSCGWAISKNLSNGWSIIVHTTNSGITWFREGDNVLFDSIIVTDVSAYTSSIAYVCGYKIPENNSCILKTIDGGVTWTKLNLPLFTSGKALYCIRTDDNDIVWAGGSNGLAIRSLNAGKDWVDKSISITDSSYTVYRIASDGALRAVVCSSNLSGENLIVYYTQNGGTSWITASPPPSWDRMLDVCWIKGTDLILGSGAKWINGVTCRSTDAGNSWAQVDSIYASITNAIFALNLTYAWEGANNNNIGYSTDGGLDWVKNQVSVPSVGGISAVDKNNVWATGYDTKSSSQTSIIVHSTDGGISWQAQTVPDSLPGLWRISFAK